MSLQQKLESPRYPSSRWKLFKQQLTSTNSAAVMGLGERCAVCVQHQNLWGGAAPRPTVVEWQIVVPVCTGSNADLLAKWTS